nr:MAG: hypothetical protein DIU68_19005 [Chloroflexota bacterium]
MKFTEAQHRAIYTHDRNLIVVAGAGSGKTSVLVNRYLALLDAHPDWPLNALVAITFTQKAAQEMRDRVRQALEDRLNAAEPGSADYAVWSRRVASMDGARIDTIHALCASILRANAAEAGVDPGFGVLDEIDAQILLDNVIDDVLREIAAGGDETVQLFTEYDAPAIRATLAAFAYQPLPDVPADLFETWVNCWREDAQSELAALLENEAFLDALGWTPPGATWPSGDDRLMSVWQQCWDYAGRLRQAESIEDRLAALAGLAGAIDLRGGSVKAWGDKEVLSQAKSVLRGLRDRCREVLNQIGEPPGEVDRRAAALVPLWVRLVRRVQEAYRAAKRAAALLDFDDLEVMTRDLLRDNPDVRARYRNGEFKHILVDEFQDTNAAQWEIIQALADPADHGRLFVVGDARQSIYAFRGADVSVFERVRRQLVELGGQEVTLSDSFRTHHTLVECFNWLFARVLTRDDRSPAREYQIALGEPMRAARQEAPEPAPALELLLIDRATANGEQRSTEECRRHEARALAARIRALVEQECRRVFDRETRSHRPMHYGDVALLFQSTTNLTLYEDVFKAEGLPFVTIAGRGYFDRQEVWDLINLLHALYNPSDNLALAAVLRSPLFGISDDALFGLRLISDTSMGPVPLWDALGRAAHGGIPGVSGDDLARVEFAATCLGELSRIAGRVTIAELLRLALDETGYLATLTGLPDGARRRRNVEKLLEKALTSGKVTLGAFSQYLRDLTANEAREGEALLQVDGAMTLMTVHRSKGLEFPVVVLVDASWKKTDNASPLLINDGVYGLCCQAFDLETDKLTRTYVHRRAEALRQKREDAERRRLLYVAATRAQDLLIIGGQVGWSQDGNLKADGWLGWIAEAFGLDRLPREDEAVLTLPWGTARVMLLGEEARSAADGDGRDTSAWDHPAVRQGAVLPGVPPASPPLLQPAFLGREAQTRTLTAVFLTNLRPPETDQNS